MTFNSTHAAIIAIAVISCVAMIMETDLAQVVPILAPLGAYAGIREYRRVTTNEGIDENWSSEHTDLDEAEIN